MITCEIIIKEIPGGQVAIAVQPDQSTATKNEMRAASLLDTAIQVAAEMMLTDGSFMVEGVGVKEHIKQVVSQLKG